MSVFKCVAMSDEDVERLRAAETDDFANTIQRIHNDETYPCRYTLREMSARDGMLLLSYQLKRPKSVYSQPTAIFLTATGSERFDEPDVVPEIVRNRMVSFRAFSDDGMMVYDANEIVEPKGDHIGAIHRIFSRPDVAFINAHTAQAGCMLAHLERT